MNYELNKVRDMIRLIEQRVGKSNWSGEDYKRLEKELNSLQEKVASKQMERNEFNKEI